MSAEPPAQERPFKVWLHTNVRDALARAGVRPRATVLDWGCGSGAFTVAAAHMVGEGGRVHATDVRPEALATVRQRAEEAGLRNVEARLVEDGPAGEGELPDAVDVILLYDVLQEVDDPAGLLRVLAGKLRPRGVLSVFPMHVGVERLLELAGEADGLEPRDRLGLVLNFRRADSPQGSSRPRG